MDQFQFISPVYVTARVVTSAILAVVFFANAVTFGLLSIHPSVIFSVSALAVSFASAMAGCFYGRQSYRWGRLL